MTQLSATCFSQPSSELTQTCPHSGGRDPRERQREKETSSGWALDLEQHQFHPLCRWKQITKPGQIWPSRTRTYFWFSSEFFSPHDTILSSQDTFRIQQNSGLFSIFSPTFAMKQLSRNSPRVAYKDCWSPSFGNLTEAQSCSAGICLLCMTILPSPLPEWSSINLIIYAVT